MIPDAGGKFLEVFRTQGIHFSGKKVCFGLEKRSIRQGLLPRKSGPESSSKGFAPVAEKFS
jgi:hypothetical protein